MSGPKPNVNVLKILAASCPPLDLATYNHPDVVRLADWATAVVLCLQEQAEPMHGPWIHVSQRLPAKFKDVLIALPGHPVPVIGQYTGDPDDSGGWRYTKPMRLIGSATVVTHWMETPDMPPNTAACQHKESQTP